MTNLVELEEDEKIDSEIFLGDLIRLVAGNFKNAIQLDKLLLTIVQSYLNKKFQMLWSILFYQKPMDLVSGTKIATSALTSASFGSSMAASGMPLK